MSKYNNNESFNPGLCLYLQPELPAQSNITTVEEITEYYNNNPDESLLWSLSYIPDRFDPVTFIIESRIYLNISGLNETIYNALLNQGFSEDEIFEDGQYISTIFENVKLIDINKFQFISDTFQISSNNLKINDDIKLTNDFVSASYATVIDITDNKTFIISSENSFIDVGEIYELNGILIYDVDRLASVNYLRYLQNNDGNPPPSYSVIDTSFNPELYKLLYPDSRVLNDEEAFIDFSNKTNINDKRVIGRTEDFFKIATNNSSNIHFDDIYVYNRLVLDLKDQNGFFRINDKNIYYISTDENVSSLNVSKSYPGLITEYAIKKYIDTKFQTTGEFNNVIIYGYLDALGDTKLLGSSNEINNAYMNNVFLHNTLFQGSNNFISPVMFNNSVKFNDSVMFNSDLILNDPLITKSKTLLSNDVYIYGDVSLYNDLYCHSNVYYMAKSFFEGISQFNNEVDFSCNVFFSETTQFQKNVIFNEQTENNDKSIFNGTIFTNSNIYNSGNTYYNDGNVIFNIKPIFNTDIEFINKLICQNEVYFNSNAIFTDTVNFKDDVIFHNDVCFNSNAFIINLNILSNLVVESTALFEDYTVFNSNVLFQDKIITGDTEIQNINCHSGIIENTLLSNSDITHSHLNNINFSSNIIFSESPLFEYGLYSSNYTELEDVKIKTIFADTCFLSNVTFLGGDLSIDRITYFKNDLYSEGILTCKNDVLMTSNLSILGFVNIDDGISIDGNSEFLSNIEFLGKSSFYNKVFYYDDVYHFKKLSILSNSEIFVDSLSTSTFNSINNFNNFTEFTSNVLISGELFVDNIFNANEIVYFNSNVVFNDDVFANENFTLNTLNVNNTADFNSNVFFNNTIFINQDLISYKHSLLSNETIIYGDLKINASTTFSNNVYFLNECQFKAEVNYLETVIFNNLTTFNDQTQYNDNVLFTSNVEFDDVSRFNSPVYFLDDIIFGKPLSVKEINTNDVSVLSNLYLLNNSYNLGSLINCNNINFDQNGFMSGSIEFKNGNFTNRVLSEFFEKTIYYNDVHFNDNVIFESNSVVFKNDITQFISSNNVFETTLNIESNLNVYGEAYFLNTSEFDDKLITYSEVEIHDKLTSFPNSEIFIKGDIYYSGNTIFESNTIFNDTAIFNKSVYINSNFETRGSNLIGGNTLFEDNIEFNSSTDIRFYGTTFFSNINIKNASINNINLSSLSIDDNAVFSSNIVFTSNSLIEIEGELNNYGEARFIGDVYIDNLSASNLLSYNNTFVNKTTISDNLEINADTDLNQTVNFNSVSIFNDKAFFENEAVFNNKVIFNENAVFEDEIFANKINTKDGSFSNLEVKHLSILNSLNINYPLLEIENVFITNLQTSHSSNQNCYITYGKSEEHDVDNITINNEISSNITNKILKSSNIFCKDLTGLEGEINYFRSSNSTFNNLNANYARIIYSSNDNTSTLNANIYNSYNSNIWTKNLYSSNISTIDFKCRQGDFSNMYSMHSELYSLTCTEFAKFNKLYSMSNFVLNQNTSNFQANNSKIKDLEVSTGNIDNLTANTMNINNLTSSNETVKNQTIENAYAQNITSSNNIFENVEVTNTNVKNGSASNMRILKGEIESVSVDDITMSNSFIAQGESIFSGTVTHCNSVDFLNDVKFDGPVETTGNLTVKGQNNKFNNIHVNNAQMYGQIGVNSTPNFNENLSVKGSYYGSRIAIGPYKKSLNFGKQINMDNVSSLNRISGTKIFGTNESRLEGGYGFLEVLQFPNAIVNLDNSMNIFEIKFYPKDINSQMIGQDGRLTFIERSIYGRTLKYNQNLVFENENNETSTTPAPDTFGGYSIDILEYSIISSDTISASYKNKSIVYGTPKFSVQNTWYYNIETNELYINSSFIFNESFIALGITKDPVNSLSTSFITFSENLITSSDYERAFILFLNGKGEVEDLLRIIETGYSQGKIKPLLISSVKNKPDNKINSKFIWATTFDYDSNNNIIPIQLYDKNQNKLEQINTNKEFISQDISLLVYHANKYDISWFLILKNSILQDIAQDKSYNAIILSKTNKNNIKIFNNNDSLVEKLTVHDNNSNQSSILTKFKKNEIYWYVSLNIYAEKCETNSNNSVLISGLKIPSETWSIKDSTSDIKELSLFNGSYFNIYIIKLNHDGEFEWMIMIINDGTNILNSFELLNNNDIVASGNTSGLSRIQAYNSRGVVGLQESPSIFELSYDDSWSSYSYIAKYNNSGIVQWLIFCSYVSNNIKTKLFKSIDGGLFFTVSPLNSGSNDTNESIIFNSNKTIAFDCSEFMKNNNKLSDEVLVVCKYDTKGNFTWKITIMNISYKNGNPLFKFENLSVLSLNDGGVVISIGSNYYAQTTDESKAEIQDTSGTRKEVSNIFSIKLTYDGKFEQ